MTIYSFDTSFFNKKSGTLYILIDVINGKVVSRKHSHKKNYSRKRDFSEFVHVKICTMKNKHAPKQSFTSVMKYSYLS